MTTPTKIQRWLTLIAMLHGTLLFVLIIGLMIRITTIATTVRDSLLTSNVAVEQVDKVNEAFSSIRSDLLWALLIGLPLLSVSFSLLRSVINRNWYKASSDQRASSEFTS